MQLSDTVVVRVALVLGLIGSVCGIFGDFFLTYTSAVPGGVPYEWASVMELVRAIPHRSLAIGHYLGVFGLQLGIFGFWAILKGFEPAGRGYTLPAFVVVVFAYVVGSVYHGQLALLGSSLQLVDALGAASDPATATMIAQHETLIWQQLIAVEVAVGLLSLWLPAMVLFRPSVYPKWFALFSPALLMGVLVGGAWLLPEPVRMFLQIAAFNLVTLLVIGVAVVFLWNPAPTRATPTDGVGGVG